MGMEQGRYHHRVSLGDRAVSKVYRPRHWKGDDREAD